MRDFVKSIGSFSWAMSLLGAKSATDLMTLRPLLQKGPYASALDSVTRAASDQLGAGFKKLYETGEQVQDSMLNMVPGSSATETAQLAAAGRVSAASSDVARAPHVPSPAPDVPFGGLVYDTEGMHADGPVSLHVRVPNTTQGPPWPPSAICNADGDFIVIGQVLTEVAPGQIVGLPGAALVSKDTVPPLDAHGREDFSNLFGATHEVIRPLDLNPGSPDLEIVLHTLSWGPFEGDFGGGGPRMPAAFQSRYNLNSFHQGAYVARDLFPATSQRHHYVRPSFPLHQVPIFGFSGDQVAYDIDTFEPYSPRLRSGPECFPDGCEGEDLINYRRQEPITLGEWLKAEVWVTITLTNYKKTNPYQGAFTAARFDLQARHLLPNSIYVMSTVRRNFFQPNPIRKTPDTAVLPNVILTDHNGTARQSRVIPNPFPPVYKDPAGLRIIGFGIGFKSDFSVPGAYPVRFGPGVDIHAQVSTFADGTADFTAFATEEP